MNEDCKRSQKSLFSTVGSMRNAAGCQNRRKPICGNQYSRSLPSNFSNAESLHLGKQCFLTNEDRLNQDKAKKSYSGLLRLSAETNSATWVFIRITGYQGQEVLDTVFSWAWCLIIFIFLLQFPWHIAVKVKRQPSIKSLGYFFHTQPLFGK